MIPTWSAARPASSDCGFDFGFPQFSLGCDLLNQLLFCHFV